MNINNSLTKQAQPRKLENRDAVLAAIENPKFQTWFKGSVVVDDSGSPLVVYHGTRDLEFSAFDSCKISDNGRFEGAGFYFTTDKSVANGYGENGRVISAFLRIINPLPYSSPAFDTTQMTNLILSAAKIESTTEDTSWQDGFLSNFTDTYSTNLHGAAAKAATYFESESTALDQLGSLMGAGVAALVCNQALFESLGYDGYVSSGYQNLGQAGGTIWVATNPRQIKSATLNTGEFDPVNPNFNG